MTPARYAIPLALIFAATVAAKPAPVLPSPPIPLPGPAGWAQTVDHPYLPLKPGTVMVYSTTLDEHSGADTVTVLRRTKLIMGITATVVRDRTYESGALVEDSYNWYAQDAAGNVWYLGEATREIHQGRVVSLAGSWEAGKDGAQPGIVMWAHPKPEMVCRQEFRAGVAEDMARVLEVGAGTEGANTSYPDCVRIEGWSPLEPGVKEHKFYARGVGLVRMKTAAGANEEMLLEKVLTP